ncbi:hypothetical protein GCM10010294_15900 [Streptomyces griseoloalbus]|uniref:SDR family oxidoreductase n=1 Tax=Streptomyces griseoloalbus TaxID=67303 RepID=UPI0018734B06|nr:hypothetical protein GCM10010294_15900 [Streptomyces griseoloalbus]
MNLLVTGAAGAIGSHYVRTLLASDLPAPRLPARARAAHGARLIRVSTGSVFTPCPKDHPTAPRTACGRSELAGEQAVREEWPGAGAIVRTAWLHGVHGANFVRTMIGLEARLPTVDVVDDQRGQPTWSADVAERAADLGSRLGDGTHGVFHATDSGEATWYDLAREVFRRAGADPDRVRPTTTAAFPRPAPRPAHSAPAHARRQEIGLPAPRDWRAALHEALPGIRKESPLRETP